MKFKEIMQKRHSTRDFKDDEIDDDVLREIVEISELTPSWVNSQPWNVYIAKGETLDDIKAEWLERNESEIKGEPDLPVGHRTDFSNRGQENMAEFIDDIAKYSDDAELEYFSHTQHVMFNAPAIVYLTLPKQRTQWSIYDLGGFGMAILMAATDKGIDSIPAYEIAKYPDVLRKHLPIPDDEDIIIGLALGYGSDEKINSFNSSRMDVDDVLKIN